MAAPSTDRAVEILKQLHEQCAGLTPPAWKVQRQLQWALSELGAAEAPVGRDVPGEEAFMPYARPIEPADPDAELDVSIAVREAEAKRDEDRRRQAEAAAAHQQDVVTAEDQNALSRA